jgi:hypothetical protein
LGGAPPIVCFQYLIGAIRDDGARSHLIDSMESDVRAVQANPVVTGLA